MRIPIALTLAALISSTSAGARPYDDIMAEVREAFVSEDFSKAADLLDEAQKERPYSLFVTRNRVLTRLLSSRKAEAYAIVKEIADRGLALETPPNEAFDAMRADPDFAAIGAQMAENAKPRAAAQVVAEYDDNSLLPEALSMRNGRTLIGAVRTGEIFVAATALEKFAAFDGGVFDIEQRKRLVYAAVNNQLAYDGDKEKPSGAVVLLDARTGELRARAELSSPEAPALIGDIEVSRKGRIFASDSLTPRIFDIAPVKLSHALVIVATPIEDKRFVNLQGVALDEKNHRLFVADYLTGLFVINLKTHAVAAIENPNDFHLGGIDGLYLHNGALIGIQNGATPQRIVRIYLDETARSARLFEVLEQAAPGWAEPTHGYVDGDDFVYIATSNWPSYDDEGNLRDDATLKPLTVMRLPIGPDMVMISR